MKRAAFLVAALAVSANAQLIPFFTDRKPPADQKQVTHLNQRPMAGQAPGIQLPPSNNDNDDRADEPTGDVILSDVLGTKSQIQIFAGFARDVYSIAKRLDTSGLNTTVLAPSNKAITALPRKPWEDPREYGAFGANAYSGKDGADRAQRNMRRFTEAHIIPISPWKEGEKVKSVGGGEVWWEKKDGKTVVQPGEVEVEGVVSRVANGEVWVLKEVLNYS